MMMRDEPVVPALDHQEAEARRLPKRVQAEAKGRRLVDYYHLTFLDGDFIAAVGQALKYLRIASAPTLICGSDVPCRIASGA